MQQKLVVDRIADFVTMTEDERDLVLEYFAGVSNQTFTTLPLIIYGAKSLISDPTVAEILETHSIPVDPELLETLFHEQQSVSQTVS